MNAKKKGNAGENAFANAMQTRGIRAHKNSSSGGNEWKSDIHNDLGLNIEVKTCKKINLKECWKQSARDAGMAHTKPVLAVHFDGMPEGDWLMVLGFEDWVDLLKNQGEQLPQTFEPPQSRELRYEIERTKAQLSKLLRLVD